MPYDFVLVDEAQFFAPIWFEIIKLILKPNGHLFMVADPTQGFLKRGQSWLASGLNVRGRTSRLEKCYRTTREILDFAAACTNCVCRVMMKPWLRPMCSTCPVACHRRL